MPRPRNPNIAEALRLVREGFGIRAAAEAAGVPPSTVSRAVQEAARPVCPCCGQVIASPRTASVPPDKAGA